MRLSIRGQLTLASVALSLIPILIAGVVAYRTARGALAERIRFNLETLASQTLDKLERILMERQQNLRTWAQLGFIRDDTVTGDADGRIRQFLQEAKQNVELYQEIWVASAEGTVIASTLPALRGRNVRERPWAQAAMRGDGWVGPPGLQDLTGRAGMPMAVPIRASFDATKTVGVLVAVLDWAPVVNLLGEVKVLPEGQSEQGYVVLTDTQGGVLGYPAFLGAWEPGKTRVESVGLTALQRESGAGDHRSAELAVRGARYLAGWATTETRAYLPGAWRAALLMHTDVAFAPLGRLMWTLVLLVFILGAAAAGASLYWANQFSRPISALVPFLNAVASGDLTTRVSVARTDELGMLAHAAGEMTAKLRGLIDEIQQAGLQITTASSEILRTSEEHASGSAEQAASIAQVTATMEELTNTAKQIAENATAVEKIADESAQAAHAGDQSVGEALAAMDKIRRRVEDIATKTLSLGEHSQRIAEVLTLIKEIAGEIHLLAVNAAIESAAAGEHGKRFAVVASEVRRLAEKTRESAEEIKGIVGEIQTATNSSVLATEQGVKEVETGVALATRARGRLEEILQMVDRTTQAIRQITLATQQQRSASEQIVQTMREVAEVTKEAAAGMKQSATSVAELNQLADQFKLRIKEFKL